MSGALRAQNSLLIKSFVITTIKNPMTLVSRGVWTRQHHANRQFSNANEMIRHGIRVYLYPGMTHVKAAIYDGWACVGPANLEKMSLRVSQEMDVAFSDSNTVDRLMQDLFVPDFSRARELKSPMTLNWLDPFVKALANQL